MIDRLVRDQIGIREYRLEALIGTGGMAEIYRGVALMSPHAGTPVAIKRLRRVVRRPAFEQLLRTESGDRARSPRVVHGARSRCQSPRALHRYGVRGGVQPTSFDAGLCVTRPGISRYFLACYIVAGC
ncbi:MAG: hypothetical protein R3C68_06060 [Myxococcota bacterium]